MLAANRFQIFVTRIDLAHGSVREEVVSDNRDPFELAGYGTLVPPLSRLDIAVSDRYVHVVYRQGEAIVVASRLHHPHVADWRLSSYPVAELGAWEPNFDPKTWELEHERLLFVQPVRQGAADHGLAGASTQITLWHFVENAHE